MQLEIKSPWNGSEANSRVPSMLTNEVPNITSGDLIDSQGRFGKGRSQRNDDGSETFISHASFDDSNSLLNPGSFLAKMYPSDEKLYFKGLLSIKKQDDLNKMFITDDENSIFYRVPRRILSYIDGCPSKVTHIEIEFDED